MISGILLVIAFLFGLSGLIYVTKDINQSNRDLWDLYQRLFESNRKQDDNIPKICVDALCEKENQTRMVMMQEIYLFVLWFSLIAILIKFGL